MRSSRRNPYLPHGRSLEIPRGRGVLKVKIPEAKYEYTGISKGEGFETKNLLWGVGGGGVWIFSGTAQ